jgi:hypothetical protein
MAVAASIRLGISCFLAVNIQACATMAAAPEIATINLVSINKATVLDMIIMGEHSEVFDVPGYKIIFGSDREMTPKDSVWLDYYDCSSSERYEDGHALSARDYVKFHQSWVKLIESKPGGSFTYEAQFIEGQNEKNRDVCAKIFVFDGNIKRKVWQPVFISNEMKLDFSSQGSPEHL